MWQKLDAALVEIRDFPSVPDEATATRFGDSLKRQRQSAAFCPIIIMSGANLSVAKMILLSGFR